MIQVSFWSYTTSIAENREGGIGGITFQSHQLSKKKYIYVNETLGGPKDFEHGVSLKDEATSHNQSKVTREQVK
ncbi:hypothetical protein AcV7_000235 [Taiwanofungus camphoratus]|nr:hypothetical protein AcV7_000235 [Antrodia cinnamomea]